MRGFSKVRVQDAEQFARSVSPADRVILVDGKLYIRISQRSDAPPLEPIDIGSSWLPPTPWAPQGTRMAARDDLLQLIAGAVRVYLRRTGESKSTLSVVRSLVSTLSKFFEYGWLHHCYMGRDWTESHTSELLKQLAKGGWQTALQIRERTQRWVAGKSTEQLGRCFNKNGGLREKTCGDELRTNARAKELCPLPELLETLLHGRAVKHRRYAATSDNGMSQTMLRQTLSWINVLADVRGGLSFTPYENVFRESHTYGRPLGRTKNITPGEVGSLLKESFTWIFDYSQPILELFEELVEAIERDAVPMEDRLDYISGWLPNSKHRELIESLLRVQLCSVRLRGSLPSDVTLQKLAQALFDACFVVIGFMNARRADEIRHPRIGIYYDALTLFDERLGLYECDFYLEKYRKAYKRFFVNSSTVAAVKVLRRSADVAVRLRVSAGLAITGIGSTSQERKITQIPRFIFHRGDTTPAWFSFNAGPNGQSRFFFERALPGAKEWHLRPHMLRRAYALIYYYRYEEGEMLALSVQLDHFSIGTTTQYITESSIPDGRVSISAYGRLTDEEKARLKLEERSVELELEVVHQEKLFAFVEAALSGADRTSGGLAKLLRRFHAKLSTRIDYADLSRHQQANSLTKMVEARGHRLRPFRHGDCGAPAEGSGRVLSRCFDIETQSRDTSQANAETCHKCAYHRASAGHVKGLQNQLKWMATALAGLPSTSLHYRRQKAEIASLEKVIAFHRAALEC